MHATGTGRWEANNRIAAISRLQRFAKGNPVILKIRFGDQPAIFLHPFRRLSGKRATIEPIAALARDGAIGGSQIRLAERFTGGDGLSAFEKNPARSLKLLHLRSNAS